MITKGMLTAHGHCGDYGIRCCRLDQIYEESFTRVSNSLKNWVEAESKN